MAGWIKVDDTWVEVQASVGSSVGYDRPVVVERTLSGRRRAQVAPAAFREWQVRLGVADAATLTVWERFVDGSYGVGPFEWVDPLKAAVAGPGSPPAGAEVRLVVVLGFGRTDLVATEDQALTSLTVTLSEVGPSV